MIVRGIPYLPSPTAAVASLMALICACASDAAQTENNGVLHANMIPVIERNFRWFLAGSSNMGSITYGYGGEEREG